MTSDLLGLTLLNAFIKLFHLDVLRRVALFVFCYAMRFCGLAFAF